MVDVRAMSGESKQQGCFATVKRSRSDGSKLPSKEVLYLLELGISYKGTYYSNSSKHSVKTNILVVHV